MKELKFRAWSKKGTNMQYRTLQELTEKGFGLPLWDESTEVMQYVCQKDQKGTDVYEDDLVVIEFRNAFGSFERGEGKVLWHDHAPMGHWTIDILGHDITGYGGYFTIKEVIGNVHQNPEILKKYDTENEDIRI